MRKKNSKTNSDYFLLGREVETIGFVGGIEAVAIVNGVVVGCGVVVGGDGVVVGFEVFCLLARPVASMSRSYLSAVIRVCSSLMVC